MKTKNILLWLIVGVIAGILLSAILTYCGVPNVFTLLIEAIFG